MGNLTSTYRTSTGKKLSMGATGLFLCTYLVVHLIGNLLLLKSDGGATFEIYAKFMSGNPFIRTIEIVLFLAFAWHIYTGTVLWYHNRRARPQRYALNHPAANSSLSSRTTFLTGSILFIFLVLHLRTFFVPARFFPESYPSMYETTIEAFSNPSYVVFYVIAMALLGYHLHHGFQSAFQTFGIRHPKYFGFIDAAAAIFWLIIPLGFALIPIYFLWMSLAAGGIHTV